MASSTATHLRRLVLEGRARWGLMEDALKPGASHAGHARSAERLLATGEGKGKAKGKKEAQNQNVVTKEYLDQARFKIFGTYIGNGLRSGRKVLRKNLIGEKVMSWYPHTALHGKVHKRDKMWAEPDLWP